MVIGSAKFVCRDFFTELMLVQISFSGFTLKLSFFGNQVGTCMTSSRSCCIRRHSQTRSIATFQFKLGSHVSIFIHNLRCFALKRNKLLCLDFRGGGFQHFDQENQACFNLLMPMVFSTFSVQLNGNCSLNLYSSGNALIFLSYSKLEPVGQAGLQYSLHLAIWNLFLLSPGNVIYISYLQKNLQAKA